MKCFEEVEFSIYEEPKNPKIVFREWITQSFAYWDTLRSSSESTLAGVTEMSGYDFSSSNAQIATVCISLILFDIL